MNKLIKSALLIAMLIGLNACMSLGKSNVESLSEVKGDEVIIVGKIEMVPKLREDEQDFPSNMFGTGQWMNKMFIAIDDQMIDMDDLGLGAGKHFGEAELGKTFFIKSKRAKDLFYAGGVVMLGNGSNTITQKQYPGGLKYTLKPGVKAIYVGTIRYHRDEFNSITKVELVNEYNKASKSFLKKFGREVKLTKVKVNRV